VGCPKQGFDYPFYTFHIPAVAAFGPLFNMKCLNTGTINGNELKRIGGLGLVDFWS